MDGCPRIQLIGRIDRLRGREACRKLRWSQVGVDTEYQYVTGQTSERSPPSPTLFGALLATPATVEAAGMKRARLGVVKFDRSLDQHRRRLEKKKNVTIVRSISGRGRKVVVSRLSARDAEDRDNPGCLGPLLSS